MFNTEFPSDFYYEIPGINFIMIDIIECNSNPLAGFSE